MLDLWLLVMMFVFGTVLGSFACCQVWRLKKGDKSKRSHCMKCKYQLRWFDNIPVVSWLMLGGKCRKCRKPIGCAEILCEIGLGVMFALSLAFLPFRAALMVGEVLAMLRFLLLLALETCMVVLFVYDLKWQEMPTKVLWGACGIATAYYGLSVWADVLVGVSVWVSLLDLLKTLLVLPAVYLSLFAVSRERWVGGGDWILCLAIALMLGKPWLGLFELFGANILGSLVCLPLFIAKRDGNIRIPFGPFLIAGFAIIYLAQTWIMGLAAF